MWEETARACALDALGMTRRDVERLVLGRLGSVQVVYCHSWQYDDPPGRLAERIGAPPGHRHYSGIGGSTPQAMISGTARRMLSGELDLALVVGGEALATKRVARREGRRLQWSHPPMTKSAFPWPFPFHPAEVSHQVLQAWLTFALFDDARRAHAGVGLGEYRESLGETLSALSAVAAENPFAWFRVKRSAGEIVQATPGNRMVAYPYTKLMTAIMDVDMAAGVILATHQAAEDLGVPAERRVYLRGWCYAEDPPYVAEREDLWRSVAMEVAYAGALRAAGVDVDDVAHLDLYACFAASVNFARDALGMSDDDPRPLTVTGGLPYHGGPGSNPVTHSLATMVDALRQDPGSLGLVSGVGMHMSKHSAGVYSTEPGLIEPPDEPAVQARADCAGRRVVLDGYEGDAVVLAASVVHAPDGVPERAVLVCEAPDGARCYAVIGDSGAPSAPSAPSLPARSSQAAYVASILREIEQAELAGRRVHLHPAPGSNGATVNVAEL